MNTPRFTGAVNKDNTGAKSFNDFQTLTFAATVNIATKLQAAVTRAVLALTGACTINVAVGDSTHPPYIGDVIELFVTSDGTTRTITWGTGVAATATTLAVTTAKYGVVRFVFNGTVWVASTTVTV